MPILLTLIIGAAVGYIATRAFGINANVPTTVGLGVLGAIVGGLTLRGLVGLMAGASNLLGMFIGGVIGAFALVWIYKTYITRK